MKIALARTRRNRLFRVSQEGKRSEQQIRAPLKIIVSCAYKKNFLLDISIYAPYQDSSSKNNGFVRMK